MRDFHDGQQVLIEEKMGKIINYPLGIKKFSKKYQKCKKYTYICTFCYILQFFSKYAKIKRVILFS